jgi:hypothetical protein
MVKYTRGMKRLYSLVVTFSNALIAILTLINFGIKSGQIRALINKTQVGLVPGFALASGFPEVFYLLQIFFIEISKYIFFSFSFCIYHKTELIF